MSQRVVLVMLDQINDRSKLQRFNEAEHSVLVEDLDEPVASAFA